ncbi:hypothetical protein ACIBAH_03350 [Streptomyces sp. NPDC051445]|uniref:hypothetical protein n=1 Tax=Streptomyces sp. NPDC051445 TaxID=3365653 RepID=UPI00379083DB
MDAAWTAGRRTPSVRPWTAGRLTPGAGRLGRAPLDARPGTRPACADRLSADGAAGGSADAISGVSADGITRVSADAIAGVSADGIIRAG